MARFTLTNEPSNVHAHTLTDREFIAHVEHQFPNPGPLIKEMIVRLGKRYPGPAEQLPHGDGRHERDDACPVCGTQLEVVASI